MPEVLEKEIVTELDPRLGTEVAENSIYRHVAKFFENVLIAEKAAEAEARALRLLRSSGAKPGEETGKSSQVETTESKEQEEKSNEQNFPPAFPPSNYPPAMPFVPVIPQTIQQVPKPKDTTPASEPKTPEVRSSGGGAAQPAKTPEVMGTPERTRVTEPRQVETPGSEERKKAYGKRTGHKTVIPEDKVNTWITASEPFFSQDGEQPAEATMPLEVPKPVMSSTPVRSSKSDADEAKKMPKTPEKPIASTSSLGFGTLTPEAGKAKTEGSADKDSGAKALSIENLLQTTESGKLVLPKELEASITEFLQKKFMNLSEAKPAATTEEAEKTAVEVKSDVEKPPEKPEVKEAEPEERRTIKVAPPVAVPQPPAAPVVSPGVKSPVKTTAAPRSGSARKSEPAAAVAPPAPALSSPAALHVETSSRRQVLLPRALREKQKPSASAAADPPPAPPVPPLPSRYEFSLSVSYECKFPLR